MKVKLDYHGWEKIVDISDDSFRCGIIKIAVPEPLIPIIANSEPPDKPLLYQEIEFRISNYKSQGFPVFLPL